MKVSTHAGAVAWHQEAFDYGKELLSQHDNIEYYLRAET
jgi:hypothetical protein